MKRLHFYLLVVGVAVAGVVLGTLWKRSIDGSDSTSDRNRRLAQETDASTAFDRTRTSRTLAQHGSVSNEPALTRPATAAESDPSSPQYDAMRSMMTLELAPVDVFEREPRDENWASGVEDEIKSDIHALFSEIGGDASLSTLECKTSSCRISFTVPEEDLEDWYPICQAILLFGQATMPEREIKHGVATITLTTVFRNDFRRIEKIRAFRAEQMADDAVQRGIAYLRDR